MLHGKMQTVSTFLAWLLIAAASWAGPPDRAAQWPHWRGPYANGTAPKADPPVHWEATKNVKRKAALPGRGSATPIVWDDPVFVVTAIPTDKAAGAEDLPKPDPKFPTKTEAPKNYWQFVVLSFDRATGKLRWRQTAAERVP